MNTSLPHSRHLRRGLTLTELLVTMMVIGILASAILFAMARAQESARVAKTNAMITALNAVVMEYYEDYMTRRVPVDSSSSDPKQAALERLRDVRILMQAELPERWSEVTVTYDKQYRTAAYQRMFRFYFKMTNSAASTDFEGAECLYMIVTAGLARYSKVEGDSDARDLFTDENVGDVDGDGAPEFLDGWGNPIQFIRWPAGFLSEQQARDAIKDHDPFDPLGLDTNAFRLVPLIFSAGPDGEYGTQLIPNNPSFRYPVKTIQSVPFIPNPHAIVANGVQMGGRLSDFARDNLHNHLMGMR